MGRVMQMFDGLRNLASGLGVLGQDKQASARFVMGMIDRPEIDACYRGTWLGRKIHDIPAKDMTREWRGWQADDDQIEAIENEERRLQLQIKVRRVLVRSRLYGGAAIIMGLPGDADAEAPKSISKGALRYLHVVHRHELTLSDQVRDPADPLFGQPRMFRLSNTGDGSPGVDIHPSRVIAFLGAEVPDGSMVTGSEDWFWGDPLLQSVKDALASHDTATGAISALLNEAKIDVIHIPGFMDSLTSSEYETQLIGRFQMASLIKSITNALLLDGGDGSEGSGETWEQKQIKWEGLPDIQRTMFQLVSGAADIPATRLIGMSPAGLNSTGESDIRNYYDFLASLQSSDLTPALAPLDDYLIQSATGSRDPAIYFEWNPLWQMSPKEKSDRDKTVAETAQIYANMGAIPDDAMAVSVQNRLIEDGVFPGLEAALEEAEKEAALMAEEPEITAPMPGDPNDPNALPDPANDPEPQPVGAPKRAAQGQGRGSAVVAMAGNSRRRRSNDRARRYVADRSLIDHQVHDATPRPLYVSRKVLNADEIRTWAKDQGIGGLIPAGEMHVTITASRDPVDWMKMGESWTSNDGKLEIAPGGPRIVERLGKAIVLLFNSWELTYRHGAMREAGASSDFSDFHPHVSLSYEPNDGLDIAAIKPFQGSIRLGPELFEEFADNAIDVKSE